MQEIYRFIEQVAPSRSTVLIQGESGHGQGARGPRDPQAQPARPQAVPRRQQRQHPHRPARGQPVRPRARRVHRRDERQDRARSRRPTAARSCSTRSRPSRPAVQAKLLRVIQEKEFLPLGCGRQPARRTCGSSPRPTRRSRKLVETGALPRGPVLPAERASALALPPLRARLEDLPLLVEHFLERFNAENGKSRGRRLSGGRSSGLSAYAWPGNVRELENVVERGVVLARGDEIGVDLLPPELQTRLGPPPPRAPARRASVLRRGRPVRAPAHRVRAPAHGGVQKHAAELARAQAHDPEREDQAPGHPRVTPRIPAIRRGRCKDAASRGAGRGAVRGFQL